MGIRIIKGTGLTHVAEDNYTLITHNLASYPMVQAIALDQNSFGRSGYGDMLYGDNLMYMSVTKVDYTSDNEIKVYFADAFRSVNTVVEEVVGQKYLISFTNGLQVRLILK